MFLFSGIANADNWQVGGLYSVPHESEQYVLLKILKTDSIGVHLKLYANKFNTKPKALSVCDLSDLDVEIEHVAISHAAFNNWGAEFIQPLVVSKEEFDAFNLWFDNNGGFAN